MRVKLLQVWGLSYCRYGGYVTAGMGVKLPQNMRLRYHRI